MDNNNQNKIYIKTDEDVPSIVDKIRKSKEREITLVVPYDAIILNNVLNLKILKKEAEELNKKISVLTADDIDDGENKNMETETDILKRKKINTVSSIKKADDFPKIKKDSVSDVFLKNDNKSDARVSENKIDLNLLSPENIVENNHSGKIKMFDIVKKVNNESEVNKKEHRFDKENYEEINNFKKDFKQSDDSIEFQAEEKLEKFSKKENRKTTIIPALSSKIATLFIFISFVVVSLAVAFVLPKADIGITLKKEIAVYDFEFVADEFLDKIDVTNSKIPLEKIEVTSEDSGSYPTTGKKHMQEEASGDITVFNEYSSSPQRIVADTRFLSKEGDKLFRVKEAVTIPGFSRVEGVDVPGQVTIKIYADKPGEEYNIGPDSFHLPGLQGSPKYTSIYARSTKSMSGGIDKEVSYFSESDYETAKKNILESVKNKSENNFLSKISEDDLFLENTKKEEKLDINTNVEMGSISDNFQMSVKAEYSAFLLAKVNLDEIINEKINSRLDSSKKLLDNSRGYEVGEVLTNKDEKIVVPIHVTQDLVTKVDIEKLKKEVAGKNETELRSYFSNMSGVMSTNVSFWPFWVKSVPSSYEKINIAIDINDSV